LKLPEWSWLIGLLFGATIGSFLNVVIYRLPRGISLSNPPNSFCPNCRHSLGPLDLFPLFSWLVSGGKCRYCKNPVPSRYFWVELLNGSLWAGVWWRFLIADWAPATAVAYMLGVSALVAIIFIDAELYIIPDELNASLLVFGLGFAAFTGRWEHALWGAFTGWAVIVGMALFGGLLLRQSAMGDGDIKMMRGAGALLGPLLAAASVGLAIPLGLVGGLGLMLWSRFVSKKIEPETVADEAETEPDPFYFQDWLITSVYYLLCLDVVALFVPALEKAVVRMLRHQPPEVEGSDEDDWVPQPTAIPFGPYLAAGAIACMLFGNYVEGGLRAYWRHATGADDRSASGRKMALPFEDEAQAGRCVLAQANGGGLKFISGEFQEEARNMRGAKPVSLVGESGAKNA
jgi:leader peptidase (prepilin peptidase)/N-methyltransferase